MLGSLVDMTSDLIAAAESGNLDEVKRLVETGAELNAQDDRGRTAVMAATHGNHPAVVEYLLAKGADVNLRDEMSDNPLLYAGAEGLLEIVRICLAAGADTKLTNRYGGIAIIPASERGHVDVVRELLTNSDTNVNHINRLGWTALLEAVVLADGGPKHQAIVQLLVDHGADINIRDKNGETALELATRRGLKEIVAILAKAEA